MPSITPVIGGTTVTLRMMEWGGDPDSWSTSIATGGELGTTRSILAPLYTALNTALNGGGSFPVTASVFTVTSSVVGGRQTYSLSWTGSGGPYAIDGVRNDYFDVVGGYFGKFVAALGELATLP